MEAILYFTMGTCLYIWKLTLDHLSEVQFHNPHSETSRSYLWSLSSSCAELAEIRQGSEVSQAGRRISNAIPIITTMCTLYNVIRTRN
jgi:hypothetical protein